MACRTAHHQVCLSANRGTECVQGHLSAIDKLASWVEVLHRKISAEGCPRRGLTLKVDESLELNLSWDVQAGSMQPTAGSQVSELPVSKHPVNCLGGVPRWNSP